MTAEERWVGIDCGFSQMTVAVLETGDVVAIERNCEPLGDGHSRDVALARLRRILDRMAALKHTPVKLAGYCYDHSGVAEAFAEARWVVADSKGLNDVVGVYGLTDMRGHAVVCGCGSFSQVAYMDCQNNVCWPGDDLADDLPEISLSGWAYASFLSALAGSSDLGDMEWLRSEVRDLLGGEIPIQSDHRWSSLGPLLGRLAGHPSLQEYLRKAVGAIVTTRDIFWRNTGTPGPPQVVLGGGAVRDEQIWRVIAKGLHEQGIDAVRATGEHAVGLARFATSNPDADAWSFVGKNRPSWL